MSPDDTAEALVAWAAAKLPALLGTYDHEPDERTARFPDAMVAFQGIRYLATQPTGAGMQIEQVQQRKTRLYDCHLILTVDPSDADAASDQLLVFADTLGNDAAKDRTLGNRVAWIAEEFEFSFQPPFVEYDDGTKGRAMTMKLTVADSVAITT